MAPAANQAVDELFEQIRDTFVSLFETGSRYQGEKIVTLVAYAVVSLGSLIWAFSGGDGGNELGASYGFEHLEPLNARILFLENESADDWTNVRVVLNRNYLHTIDRVRAGERAALPTDEFSYFFYVPRPWGQHEWETLDPTPKPGPHAGADLVPEVLNVRADQGRIDIVLQKPGEGEGEAAAPN